MVSLTYFFPSLSPGCITGCDFDEMDDLCGWTTEVSDPTIMGWEFWIGQTETPGTGPDDDFSKPGCKSNPFDIHHGLSGTFSKLVQTLKVLILSFTLKSVSRTIRSWYLSWNPPQCFMPTFLSIQWDFTCWWIPSPVSQGPQHSYGVHLWQLLLLIASSWTSIITCMAQHRTWSLMFMLSPVVRTSL